jgi:DNA-binding XRE family transcriptional regulator
VSPLETYRTWDSGRRHVRPAVLTLANARALRCDPHALLPLDTLAPLIRVHVRTLLAAAKDGRLRVTYDTRTTFRRLRTRATLADAEYFLHAYFETAVSPTQRPAPLRWDTVPLDCAVRIRNLRQQLGMTLAEFAAQVGAAFKAVKYQWESEKRCPSPLFWQRIQDMEAGSEMAARAGDS